MTTKLTERVQTLEAQVAALQGMLLSFMVATQRAERFITATTVKLAEEFCDDAIDARQRTMALEMDHLLSSLARMHQSGEDSLRG